MAPCLLQPRGPVARKECRPVASPLRSQADVIGDPATFTASATMTLVEPDCRLRSRQTVEGEAVANLARLDQGTLLAIEERVEAVDGVWPAK
jgi:hypothetical protein